MLITDSIELAGLPDGVYPPNGQISSAQLKRGNKVTYADNEGLLIWNCIGLDECVRNLMAWAGVRAKEAVRSENVAAAMRLMDRGMLKVGRKGDFVVLGKDGRYLVSV